MDDVRDGGGTAAGTLAHYDEGAEAYAAALLGHDTADLRAGLLAALPPGVPRRLLDLGCGPGRDLAAFAQAGHEAVGVEGSPALAAIAHRQSGCRIHTQDLTAGPLPPGPFAGALAIGLFFTLPTEDLTALLRRLTAVLVPQGGLCCCDPMGDGRQGTSPDGRYVSFRRPQTYQRLIREAGFTLVQSWRRPLGKPRRQQAWLATVWTRQGPDPGTAAP